MEDSKKIFEKLKDFLINDLEMKESLFNSAPNEMDDYDEESRIQYTDKICNKLNDYEIQLKKIAEDFNLGVEVSNAIANNISNIRNRFLIGKYDQGLIKKLYEKQFSSMSGKLIEDVKNACVGYKLRDENLLPNLINESHSINELLHVMHSFIMNNEEILESMPVVDVKAEDNEPITLYGEENDISRKIFDNFPTDSKCGVTDIISTKDKIIMMVRDLGHALSVDIDISKDDEIIVKYFVPKICNGDMIQALPGINQKSITENGATGIFKTSKDEISNKINNFIEMVPTDLDNPIFSRYYESETENIMTNSNCIFETKDAETLAKETGEKGRKFSTIGRLYNKFREITKFKKKEEKGTER